MPTLKSTGGSLKGMKIIEEMQDLANDFTYPCPLEAGGHWTVLASFKFDTYDEYSAHYRCLDVNDLGIPYQPGATGSFGTNQKYLWLNERTGVNTVFVGPSSIVHTLQGPNRTSLEVRTEAYGHSVVKPYRGRP